MVTNRTKLNRMNWSDITGTETLLPSSLDRRRQPRYQPASLPAQDPRIINTSLSIDAAVPVLQATNVQETARWYHDHLGFEVAPFPKQPPYDFAILSNGAIEIMLRCGSFAQPLQPVSYSWDIYLRITGNQLRSLYTKLQVRGLVTRRLERTFYGLAEFEIADPDGHVICLSEELADSDDLPTPKV